MRVLGRSAPARRDESGTAALEFALVLPLLLTMFLGIITTGLSYNNSLGISSGVREGSRFGATAGSTTMASWNDNVIARTRDLAFNQATSANTQVCVQLLKVSSSTASPPSSTLAPITGVTGVADKCTGPSLMDSDKLKSTLTVGYQMNVNACLVRVAAARNYEIALGIGDFNGVVSRVATTKFERTDVYTTCVQ